MTAESQMTKMSLKPVLAWKTARPSRDRQVQTDCRHTTSRSACSRPVTEGYRLLISNVAMTSMTVAPAIDQ